MNWTTIKALSAAAVISLAATAAHAHGALVSATPAAGSTVASTSQIRLQFNEAVKPKFSGAELTMTSMLMGGKLVNHAMKVDGVSASVDPKDGKTMLLKTAKPLAPGGYKLTWHVVSADNHRVEGGYAFTVR